MVKNNQYPGGIRLTLKKARELAVQEFGTAKGLEAERDAMPGYFHMRFGNLGIRIHPDIRGSGCIVISVGMAGGLGSCTQYHDPETLKENFDVEERYSREEKRDTLKDWVDCIGPEACHAEVDRIWNRR